MRTLPVSIFRLLNALSIGFAFVCCLCISAHAQVVVQSPVRISQRGASPHFWWTISASPSDPRRIVACALQNRPEVPVALRGLLYGSEDGGLTWKTLYIDNLPLGSSEVSCAVGKERTIYYVDSNEVGELGTWYRQSAQDRLEHVHLLRSTDFGAHWRSAPLDDYADSASLIVDPGKTPDQDRVAYFADDAHHQLARGFTLSTDGGRTLGAGAKVLPSYDASTSRARYAFSSDAVKLPNGMYGGVYTDQHKNAERRVPLYVSINRVSPDGTPAGLPIRISQYSRALSRTWTAGSSTFFSGMEASIATGVLPNSHAQRVYASWYDFVKGHVHVMLASSDDSGGHWSAPRVVDDAPQSAAVGRDVNASHASVAVNAAGAVGVEWAEFNGRCWRLAVSFDGGRSFGKSVPVNSCAPQNMDYTNYLADYISARGVPAPSVKGEVHLSLGDWRGYENEGRGTALTFSGNSFYAVWASFGSGDNALYSTRVDVNDPQVAELAKRRLGIIGDQALKLLRGTAHDTAWITFTNLDYDEGTREFTVGAVLVKPHSADATWPIVVKAKALKSYLGPLEALNADNSLSEKGAAWVFDGPARILPSGSLAAMGQAMKTAVPLDYSEPRTLRFRVSGPLQDGRKYYLRDPLVDITFQVFTLPKE